MVGKARSLNCGRSPLLRFKWNRLVLFSMLAMDVAVDLEIDLGEGVETAVNWQWADLFGVCRGKSEVNVEWTTFAGWALSHTALPVVLLILRPWKSRTHRWICSLGRILSPSAVCALLLAGEFMANRKRPEAVVVVGEAKLQGSGQSLVPWAKFTNLRGKRRSLKAKVWRCGRETIYLHQQLLEPETKIFKYLWPASPAHLSHLYTLSHI